MKSFYEIHHPDDTIARFELMNNSPTGERYYSIRWVRDPFDNLQHAEQSRGFRAAAT